MISPFRLFKAWRVHRARRVLWKWRDSILHWRKTASSTGNSVVCFMSCYDMSFCCMQYEDRFKAVMGKSANIHERCCKWLRDNNPKKGS